MIKTPMSFSMANHVIGIA